MQLLFFVVVVVVRYSIYRSFLRPLMQVYDARGYWSFPLAIFLIMAEIDMIIINNFMSIYIYRTGATNYIYLDNRYCF